MQMVTSDHRIRTGFLAAPIDEFHSPIWVISSPFGRVSRQQCNPCHCQSMARPLPRNRFLAGDAASLILRASLTITLAILSVSSNTASTRLSVTAAILGCLIGSGFLTRGAAAASVALAALCDHGDMTALVSTAAEALSLVLVGAGAWSLDALFSYNRFPGWWNRA